MVTQKIVLAQWFLINGVLPTFDVSCRENLLGQIPRNCVSMAFLCSKTLERTKFSGVQNHSPKFGGIFWVVGNYPKWRLREGPKKTGKSSLHVRFGFWKRKVCSV